MTPQPGSEGLGNGERELEALLRSMPPAPPGLPFRDRVRKAFLAGSVPGGEAEEASRPGQRPRMDPGLYPAFEQWLATVPLSPPAREAFRSQTRSRFLAGGIQEVSAPPARPRGKLVRIAVPVLAAAAILAVTFFLPEPPRWKVKLEGPVRLAGKEYRPEEANRFEVELAHAATLESLVNRVELSLEGLTFLVLPGSEFLFPDLPDLDGATPIPLTLAGGEVYLRTGPDYRGNPIRIHTREEEVLVAGTSLGILADEQGTCVCVAEGKVGIEGALIPGGTREVEAGQSYRVFPGGGMDPKLMPFPGEPGEPEYDHVQELLRFAER